MIKRQILQIVALSGLCAIALTAQVARAALAPMPGQWARYSLAGMESWIYTPKGSSANPSLMISLHGCSQSAGDLKSEGNWEAAADLYNTVVVLPNVPNGGVIVGCWDYYGQDQTESNKDTGPLLGLLLALEGPQSSWKINPSHVSISGLSSGATEAMLMACLHPDLFSGVGLASGPIVGSDISDISDPRISASSAAAFCQSLATSRSGSFATQIASIIFDDQDSVVNPRHSQLSKAMLASLYQAASETAFNLSGLQGSNRAGSGALLGDATGRARVSVIINRGIGHAWASGKGTSLDSSSYDIGFMPGNDNYINPNSVNYPLYLLGYLSQNSLRP